MPFGGLFGQGVSGILKWVPMRRSGFVHGVGEEVRAGASFLVRGPRTVAFRTHAIHGRVVRCPGRFVSGYGIGRPCCR